MPGLELPPKGSDLKYNLSVISQEEFETFHTLVQSVFDEGRQVYHPKLMQVSTDWTEMPEVHHAYLTKSDCLGVCMSELGMENEEFHVWITPSYIAPMYKFYMTLAHELCHGYVGTRYGHNAHWRRWFYRVLWHLNEAKLIPEPESELKWVGVSVEYCYNYKPNVDPMLTIMEAFNKAKSEHSQVMNNFLGRMNA